MKRKPQLEDIDVAFDPRPLTKAEEKAISDFIREDKEKRKSCARKARTANSTVSIPKNSTT